MNCFGKAFTIYRDAVRQKMISKSTVNRRPLAGSPMLEVNCLRIEIQVSDPSKEGRSLCLPSYSLPEPRAAASSAMGHTLSSAVYCHGTGVMVDESVTLEPERMPVGREHRKVPRNASADCSVFSSLRRRKFSPAARYATSLVFFNAVGERPRTWSGSRIDSAPIRPARRNRGP